MAHYISASDENLFTALESYKKQWTTNENIIDFVSKYNTDDFEAISSDVMDLGNELRKRKLMNTKNIERLIVFNNILEKIHYSKHIHNHHACYQHTMNDGYDYNANIDVTMFKFTPVEFEELKPFQKLIFIMMDVLSTKELRHVGDQCYRQIKTDDGHPTHAWESYKPIKELLHAECNMISNFGNWTLITSGRDVDKQVTDHLTNTKDQRFPELIKNRNVFAFKNGLYFTNSKEAIGVYSESDKITDLFIEYTDPQFTKLSKSIVACKYFDQEFRDIIETPYLDSIFEYQELPKNVIEICKMFIGRMMYDVGALDTWQVIPMYLGSGGSGKSTLIQIMTYIYDQENVGIMGT